MPMSAAIENSLPELAPADRVLLILAVMGRNQRPMTAQELVDACQMPRSSLYRQLARLKSFGLLQEQAGMYTPGPLCLQLSIGFERDSNLVRVARPVLEQLSLISHESAGLIVASNDQALCLIMAESPLPLRCSFEPGRSVPLHRGASALCLLAHLPTPQRELQLTRYYGADTPERAHAQQNLHHIREAGYVITEGEVDLGVWGCSAPIFGPSRRAVAALTLMAPALRLGNQRDTWLQHTLTAAARISRALKD